MYDEETALQALALGVQFDMLIGEKSTLLYPFLILYPCYELANGPGSASSALLRCAACATSPEECLIWNAWRSVQKHLADLGETSGLAQMTPRILLPNLCNARHDQA